jgi:hypothetical protein
MKYQYIVKELPMLSGDLGRLIARKEKIKNIETARKIVSRLRDPIFKTTNIFLDRQSLVYHISQHRKPLFFEKLTDSFKKYGKAYYAIILAMESNLGVMKKKDLANYSLSPIINMKGHMNILSLVDNLRLLNVITDLDSDHFQLNPDVMKNGNINYHYYRATDMAKKIVLTQFKEWAANIGLVSYHKLKINGNISGFQFGLTAPTYISGIVRWTANSPKPGFLILDLLLKDEVGESDVDFFIQKLKIIKARTPTLNILPIILLNRIKGKNAMRTLKSQGIIIGFIKEIFGQKYTELLYSLINIINNAGAILKKNPQKYLKIMEDLSKLVDGKTLNLKGDLFELAVAYYYSKMGCDSLEVGKRVTVYEEGKTREIDIFAKFQDRLIMVECKGTNYPMDLEYIKKYATDNVPTIRKWFLKSSYCDLTPKFEIWSTKGFTKDALSFLKNFNQTVTKYKIDYFSGKDILQKSKGLKSKKFEEILNHYYLT